MCFTNSSDELLYANFELKRIKNCFVVSQEIYVCAFFDLNDLLCAINKIYVWIKYRGYKEK